MTYSVYQHWDRLKVCAVGKSYPPELYDYIKNEKVRKVFYKMAEETEEDYQKLIKLLETFDIKTVRPNMSKRLEESERGIKNNTFIPRPSEMQPRDYCIMLGEKFYYGGIVDSNRPITDLLTQQGNVVERAPEGRSWATAEVNAWQFLNAAMISRIGRDLIVGTPPLLGEAINMGDTSHVEKELQDKLPEYRIQKIDTQGHTDGTFCPVVPGLIISNQEPLQYGKTFPGWEVVALPKEMNKVQPFLEMKYKNEGKWWVPGQELNDDFTSYVETWMSHWVGYVEESVFDVNMLVIDKHNVIVNGYNKTVFDAFSRHNITPHVCNFRHRYFWDGGLHCITTDLHREGVMEDYFPDNG